MTGTGLLALLSHWRRHKVQLATLLIGLALATGLWTGVQAINQQARTSYDAAASVLGQNALARLQRADSSLIPTADFVRLRQAGWLVSPVVEGTIRAGGIRLTVLGIDPLTAPPSAATVDLTAEGDLADFLAGDGLLFVNPETADRLPLDVLPPLRHAPDIAPAIAVTDITTAWRLLETDGFTHLLVRSDQPLGLAPLAQIAPELQLISPGGTSDIARLTDSFHLNLTAFGFLAFAVGLFIVHAAIGLAFEQRRPMFRTLRALGLPTGRLVALLAVETTVLAVVAGLAGVALGYLVAALLLPDVAATLRGLYGAQVAGTLRLDPVWAAAGLGVAVIGAAVAAAQSLWRVATLPVLAPAQPRAWAMATSRALRRQAGLAIILLAATAILIAIGRGLPAGFATLGGLLLGAALLLPTILGLLLRIASNFGRSPVMEWVWADTRQQIPGLSLALMALLLALAASIGVGTMVSSFRLTFTGWLDQRLASELYVTAASEDQAVALRTFLEGRVDAVIPIRSVDARVAGAPGEIYGIVDHATYRDHWPLVDALPDVWDRIAENDGALINEQLYRRHGLALGDLLILPGGWTEPVVGVYSDYGNPTGQVIVGLDTLTARYPDVDRRRHGVRVPPADVPALIEAVGDEFDLARGNLVNQDEIKQASLAVFERTFLVTGALNVLTLGVAAFAMLTSLLTLSTMRLPQLAPIWALGLTRRQLAGLELLRTVALALLTWLIAVPVGLALAWVLLAVVNVEAFGWRLPMYVFPIDWLQLAAWAIVAALIAAALPVWRLARIAPARLLMVFSHER